MLRLALALTTLIAACVASLPMAHAGTAGQTAANAVPHNIVELIASGSWIDADLNGTYRAVLVATGTPEEPMVEIYVQWLAAKTDGGPVEVISSVPVKEFNDQKLAAASISMETEIDGQADLVITGQNAKNGTDVLISIRATKPGVYQIQTQATPAGEPDAIVPAPMAPPIAPSPPPAAP